jgi:ParB family transcriptional regulator, chromosome partitioning protein
MTAAKIAKATGTKPGSVKKALTVGGSPIATAAAERYDLTLDQALVLAEFDQQPEDLKVLVAVAKKTPGQWDHTVSRLRRDRAEAAARQATIDRLADQGVTIIDHDNLPPRTLRLSSLADSHGRPIDPQDHASCPGHAVTLDPWDPERTVAYCIQPDTHGHTDRYPTRTTARTTGRSEDGKLTDQAKAERRQVVEHNRHWRAAQPVRRDYIKALLARRTPPKTAPRYIAAEVLGRPQRLGDATDEMLAELLGVACQPGHGRRVGPATVADTPDTRLPLLLLAQVAAAYETTMDVHIWRSAHPDAARWLQFLAGTGYSLSPVEQLAIDTAAGARQPHDIQDNLDDVDVDNQDGPDAA